MAEFDASNKSGAREMYLSRSVYDSHILTTLNEVRQPTIETLQIKDLQKDEKMLFGRVNLRNRAITADGRYLKSFPSNPGLLAMDFVVEAHTAMKKKFDQALRTGYISRDQSELVSLTPTKAYINPLVRYNSHLEFMKSDFLEYVKRKNRLSKISNFDTFVLVFMEYLKLLTPEAAVTKSMYLLTKHTSPLSSGLMFEISTREYDDDKVKAEMFYKNNNFEYFKNLAYQNGFIIDKHIPWRLIADLNAPNLAPHITAARGYTIDASGILALSYTETYSGDIPLIINLLLDTYNATVQHRPVTVTPEPGPSVSPYTMSTTTSACKTKSMVVRAPETLFNLEKTHATEYWLDLYTRIRNLETNLGYDEETIQAIVQRSTDLLKKLDKPTALRYIMSKFDNVSHIEGSLFHDITRIEMAEDPEATAESVDETVQHSVQASNFIVY
jgi:hypothetical protein